MDEEYKYLDIEMMELSISVGLQKTVAATGVETAVKLDSVVARLSRQGFTRQEIIDNLTDQLLNEVGPIAKMMSNIATDISQEVNRTVAGNSAFESADGNLKTKGVWIATGMNNMCSDCSYYDGKEMTLEKFLAIHGTTLCGNYCYCIFGAGATKGPERSLVMKEFVKENPEWYSGHVIKGTKPKTK